MKQIVCHVHLDETEDRAREDKAEHGYQAIHDTEHLAKVRSLWLP